VTTEEPIVLYGSPMSLYTGRVRSYLIKSRIPYVEQPHATPHYQKVVLPKAGGRRGIPTIEFPDGRVIRDGVAILDHFESLNDEFYSPDTVRQSAVSRLLDAIASEGLLRPCMHYRWNHDQSNREFLQFHFETIYKDHSNPSKMAADRMQEIRENVNPAWGVVPETHDLIESMHVALLTKLNQHFSKYPYFLGSKPCIADFGMMAPMYGHLGRDPKPLALMQEYAVRVFRWTERMNRPEPDFGEFEFEKEEYLSNDEVPETLIEILRHFAVDFVPETNAACHAINKWLQENPSVESGQEAQRFLTMCHFEVDGVQIKSIAQPFRFYLLERLQRIYEDADESEQNSILNLLKSCDMDSLLDMKLTRAVLMQNNLEVWGPITREV
jgi:glutathione S-transferase